MDIHRYQLGNDPLGIEVSVLNGKPRLTTFFVRDENGAALDPPEQMHMATFVSEAHAASFCEWLDAMTKMVQTAIQYHAKMSALHMKATKAAGAHEPPAVPDITDITHLLQLLEQRHGAQN